MSGSIPKIQEEIEGVPKNLGELKNNQQILDGIVNYCRGEYLRAQNAGDREKVHETRTDPHTRVMGNLTCHMTFDVVTMRSGCHTGKGIRRGCPADDYRPHLPCGVYTQQCP
eukprot:GFYU01023479.1.p1 GENE.GFYU01023479.1~~GFYU01023479.1.p1  ORF type:complete len:112 (-),score=4.88 GFYU01023479.1:269-604(-)